MDYTPSDGTSPGPGGPASRPARWRAAALLGAALVVVGGTAVTMAASPAPSSTTAPDSSTDTDGTGRWQRGAGLVDGFVGFAGPHRGLAAGNITITGIDGSSIALATVDGWTRTIQVTSETEITKDGETIALSDLEVGDRIRFAQTAEDDVYTVTAIDVVLPHAVGQVTAVDGDSLTLELPDGSSLTVRVSSSTEITVAGEGDQSVSDIETGMVAIVAGEEASDGSIDATSIRAGSIWQRVERGGGRGGFGRGGDPFGGGPFGGGPFGGGPFWDDDTEDAAPSASPDADTSAG